MINIVIDNRESQLIELFSKQTEILKEKNIEWSTQTLEIGDVMIHNNEGSINYLFERKTLSDLAGSIKDGRYREQKMRMLSKYASTKITYILEEISTNELWSSASASHIMGISKIAFGSFIIHTMLRDGVHVYISKNTEETSLFIMGIAYRMIKHPELFEDIKQDSESVTYTDVCKIKTKKQENITPEICCILQFGQIPGISSKLAKVIMEHTNSKSMREWIMNLEINVSYEEKVKYILSIPGFGKKKAETLLSYFGYVK